MRSERKVLVNMLTRDKGVQQRIKARFGLPRYRTLNGWTPGSIKEADWDAFTLTAKMGFIIFREVEWEMVGGVLKW